MLLAILQSQHGAD